MATIETLENSKVKLTIEVSKELFEHGLDHAYESIKKDVEVKGFRKGSVPKHIYESKFGVESLYDEALNHVIGDTYYQALVDHDVLVVAQPEIDLDIQNVKRGEAFTYTAIVAVKPEVKLGAYKKIEMKTPETKVTDADVLKEIEKLQSQNAELKLVEDRPLKDGDTAIFDFKGTVDGVAFEGGEASNYELKIGSGQFIPGFESGMVGLKTGEEKDVDVTFPENYQAKDLAGKKAVFHVKLHEIKETILPKLTDDFVKELEKEGIKTVDELKKNTLETLTKQKESAAKNQKVDFAVQQASDNATINIPEEMIVAEKNRMLDNTKQQASQYGIPFEQYLQFTGTNQEAFEAKLLEDAKKSVRYNLVLEAIAKEEKIEATEEEIKAKYQELADQYKLTLEQLETQISREVVVQDIAMNKAVDLLVDSLKLV